MSPPAMSRISPRPFFRLLLAAAAFAFAPADAFANDSATADAASTPAEPKRLPPVVVSAPAPLVSATTLDAYAAPQTVVGRDQIETLGAMDIGSALRTVPGVTISRHNIAGSYGGASGGGVFIRGLGASRPGGELVTLYDGVPRLNPIFSHPLLDLLSVDAAREFTVHKAPAPQLFGNGFAAIAITPRGATPPAGSEWATAIEGRIPLREIPLVTGEILAAGGSYGTVIESVSGGGRGKDGGLPLEISVGQSYRASDGHRRNSGGEMEDYRLHAAYKLSERWTLTFNGDHTNNHAADPGATGAATPHMGDYHSRDSISVLTLANDYSGAGASNGVLAGATGHVKLYWHNGHAAWHDENGVGTTGTNLTDMDWDAFGAHVREVLRPWRGGEVTAGADADVTSGKYNTARNDGAPGLRFPREDFCTYSAYAAVAHTFGKTAATTTGGTGAGSGFFFTPSAGVRLYGHNHFGFEHSPHAGFVAGNATTEFHANYARGVNFPGLLVAVFHETIMPPLASNPALRRAWRDLDAETLDHFEVGVTHRFTPRLEVTASVFHDDGRNRYIMQFASGSMMPAGFANAGRYTNHGIEASATWKPLDDLSLFAGGTWLHSSVKMPYAPEWSASAGVTWVAWKDRIYKGTYKRGEPGSRSLRLTFDTVCQSSTLNPDGWSRMTSAAPAATSRVPAFCVLNARIAYDFNYNFIFYEEAGLRRFGGELFLNIENLTNTHYRYRNGYPMPGTTITGGMKLNF